MKSVVLETSDLADQDLPTRRRRELQAKQATAGSLGGIKTFPAPLETPLKPPSHFLEEKIISFASQNLNIFFFADENFSETPKIYARTWYFPRAAFILSYGGKTNFEIMRGASGGGGEEDKKFSVVSGRLYEKFPAPSEQREPGERWMSESSRVASNRKFS